MRSAPPPPPHHTSVSVEDVPLGEVHSALVVEHDILGGVMIANKNVPVWYRCLFSNNGDPYIVSGHRYDTVVYQRCPFRQMVAAITSPVRRLSSVSVNSVAIGPPLKKFGRVASGSSYLIYAQYIYYARACLSRMRAEHVLANIEQLCYSFQGDLWQKKC